MTDDDIDRRLLNWALWYWGGSGRSGSPYPIYNIGPRPPRAGSSIPILGGEAADTDTAVNNLPTAWRDALRARYLFLSPTGARLRTLSDAQVARRLGCARSTYYERIASARKALSQALRAKKEQSLRRRPINHTENSGHSVYIFGTLV